MDRRQFKSVDEGQYLVTIGSFLSLLRQVYLPAIEGYVPPRVLHAMKALLEFCYIVCHDVITEETLVQLDDALARFLEYRDRKSVV